MSKVSAVLRRGEGRYFHWCPACNEMHQVTDAWSFNGNLDAPTFSPSVRHGGVQRQIVDGKWTGEWVRGPDGEPLPFSCHYFIRAGQIEFCGDCTHELAGKTVPMPVLPEA